MTWFGKNQLKTGVAAFWVAGMASAAFGIDASKVDRRIPDELETSGGQALGIAGGGVATLTDISAVRINPALLSLEKQYSLYGGYHWPSAGREFYDTGIIDSKTSPVAAAFSMTGFTDPVLTDPIERQRERDTLLERRFSLAFGKTLEKLALGVGGSYVTGFTENRNEIGQLTKVKGTTLGAGIAGLITPSLRFGASIENMNNRKVAHIAPRTVRAGLAYLTLRGNLALNLDYKERQRIASVEESVTGISTDGKLTEVPGYRDPERMAIASFVVKAYDIVRILGAYGHSFSEDKRRSLSGGIGLVHKGFSIFYTASRPYLAYESTHSAINVSMMVTL